MNCEVLDEDGNPKVFKPLKLPVSPYENFAFNLPGPEANALIEHKLGGFCF